jgi:hypothetical protein
VIASAMKPTINSGKVTTAHMTTEKRFANELLYPKTELRITTVKA